MDIDTFDKSFNVNDIVLNPIASFKIDEYTRIGVTELFDAFFVYSTLDSENYDVFRNCDDALKAAEALAAEMLSWHIPGADD